MQSKLCAVILAIIVSYCSCDGWQMIKNYDLSNMDQVRKDWTIEKWGPGTVNNELQTYVDNPQNLFIENGNLVIRAKKKGQSAGCSKQNNKDIQGSDLSYRSNTPEHECCSICVSTNGCKAYSWSDYQGGTCWLKKSTGPIVDKQWVKIGVIGGSEAGCKKQVNKDISGNDLSHKSHTPESECCSICQNTNGCKAYSWSNYIGGTCWLKSSTTPVVDGQGVNMGVLGISSGSSGPITSGRLLSKQTFSPVNVGGKLKVEFQAQIPTAMGAWPALWMLGQSGVYGNWPQEGEIDVMEWVWQLQATSKASLHWKGPMDWATDFHQLSMKQLSLEFTTYGVEYSSVANQEYIQFYIVTEDGRRFNGKTAKPSDWRSSFHPNPACRNITPGAKRCSPLAPFDNNMHLIMNLAVGGDWGGCCGVTNYDAFDGNGVKFTIKRVSVYKSS